MAYNSSVVDVAVMKLLQLLKAHIDYKERTQLLSSCDVMTDSSSTVTAR